MTLIPVTNADNQSTFKINTDQVQYVTQLEDKTFIVGMVGIKFHIVEDITPKPTV